MALPWNGHWSPATLDCASRPYLLFDRAHFGVGEVGFLRRSTRLRPTFQPGGRRRGRSPSPVLSASACPPCGQSSKVRERVAVSPLDRDAVAVEEVTGRRVELDRDSVVDSCRNLTVRLEDRHRAISKLDVEVGFPSESLHDHHLARKLAFPGEPHVLGSHAKGDLFADFLASRS